ncbi:partner of numb [Musca autumnalis]|uniref:partner of numb n=1 Tax=Musca autumnalis TaxID=221902 RepID=UPI003CEBED87
MIAELNSPMDQNITPSRKRKRQQQTIKEEITTNNTGFTNEAFSSTPKKILAKRRLNKENAAFEFASKAGLEIKPIAAKDVKDTGENLVPANPFEVLRKPPKKKKRPVEVACFENPALNINVPEKQFNPYEVVRESVPLALANSNCFVNPALNLKTQDDAPASKNPFEIQRDTSTKDAMPCKLKIGLPFVPNVGCRIDFKDMSMSQLTPTKLLAEKLVFSPVVMKPNKVSLGSIGEEETMDIGKELDCYQLELENSINEAKLRKNGINEHLPLSPIEESVKVEIEETIEKHTHLQMQIKEGIVTKSTEESTETTAIKLTEEPSNPVESKAVNTNPFEQSNLPEVSVPKLELGNNPFALDDENDIAVNPEDLEELYGPDSDIEGANESFDFKTPAPFVRAYTKAGSTLKVSKESLEKSEDNNNDKDGNVKKSMNVKNMIRKSIRKLMHPSQQTTKASEACEGGETDEAHEKHSHGGILNSIRHSLRRKPNRVPLEEEHSHVTELSIIDGSERTMKLKSDLVQTEYVKIEDLTNEKKHTLRNSIRRSTREMGHQLMKSVFHKKHEEYDFK